MIMTLSTYFITIVISNYLYYLIVEMNNNSVLNKFSFIAIIVIGSILTYFTYHPLKVDFFRDPTNGVYGIPK